MRDPKRIPKILARLQKIWEQYPDLRLGQLIENVYPNTPVDFIQSYFIEDAEYIRTLETYYAKNPIYRRCGKKRSKNYGL